MGAIKTKEGQQATTFVVFEPQPQFRDTLGKLDTWPGGAVHVQGVAWTSRGELPFSQGRSPALSQAAHVGAPREGGPGKLIKVQSVDFARFLNDMFTDHPEETVFLKIDVEGAEYDLLPNWLISGALCPIEFIQIEWHMFMLKPERRLASLGLRMSMADMLERGCPYHQKPWIHPQRTIVHDEAQGNRHVAVPGLRDRLDFHAAENASTCHSTAGGEARREALKKVRLPGWDFDRGSQSESSKKQTE